MSDFTFRDPLTGIIRFNDANVIHIGYEPSSEDITITAQNDETGTSKTITANMSGGGGSAVLGQKTITANGTYDASDDGLDGYDQVTVNVPATGITVDQLATNSAPTGDIVIDASITELGMMSFGGKPIKSFTGAGVTKINFNSFGGCSLLETLNLPEMLDYDGINTNNANYGKIPLLTKLYIPKVKTLHAQSLCQLPALENLALPSFTGNPGANHFNFTGSGIKVLDLGVNFGDFANNGFTGASHLDTLIIRKSTMATLANTSYFNATALSVSGTGGDIYVPSSLVTTYENATNWSALNATFKAIEGSYYETHYADGTEVTP